MNKNNTIKKILIKTFATFALFFIFTLPIFAQTSSDITVGGFVVCDGGYQNPCTFEHVMILLRQVLNFFIYKLVTPIFVIMLMWQGIKMITSSISGAKPVTLTELKKSIQTILVGYLWVLGAWLIVKTIIVILAGETPSFGVFFN
ncbi:MAG: hypothetical protein ACR2IQ_01295 [Minisyncoccia bacterium]